jgi:cholesterol oxidase
LIYGGVLVQPRPGPFQQFLPAEIDYDELDRVYYPRARRRLVCAPFPEDLLAHDQYYSNRLWSRAAHASGLPVEDIVGNYDFDVIRAELDGTVKPAATRGQYHFTGCNSGAKMSVDRTYLARAEATGKTEVRTLHAVTDIAQEGQDRYRVSVARLSRDGAVVERLVLVCDRLVVAAGVHSPRLLVTARDTGALPRLPDSVGSQWGTNGDQLSAIQTWPRPLCAPEGGPPAVLVRNREGTATLIHAPLPLQSGAGLLPCLGMGISNGFGRWTYSAETADTRLEWSAGNDTSARQAVRDLGRQVAQHFPAGATFIHPPPSPAVTAHPVGGVALGKATDLNGRLHGYSGLYCLDGALMPGSTAAANPALTIAAIVERCLDGIIGDFNE